MRARPLAANEEPAVILRYAVKKKFLRNRLRICNGADRASANG